MGAAYIAELACVKCMLIMVVMRQMDLRRLDLNLLVSLDVLLEARNVTRAAEQLGLSQPAASRALARLRQTFGDPLLVEARGGYLLSSRAEALQPQLRRVLSEIGALVGPGSFEPATAEGEVRLVMPDLLAATFAPRIVTRIAAEAPCLRLEIVPPGPALFEELETGEADAAVGVIDDAPPGFLRRGLYRDGFLTLLRAGHPAAGSLTLDTYVALRHIAISVTGVGPAPVDVALRGIGRTRTVAARVPSFLAAVEMVAASDLVVTLPETFARQVAAGGRFVAVIPPLDLPGFTMSLAWHARFRTDPRHGWLRGVAVAAAAEMGRDA